MGMPTRIYYDPATVEALDYDTRMRDLVLRMAGLVHTGRLESFRRVVRDDPQLDEETRSWVLALAESESFLLAAALYLERSRDVN
jgi:hypothetical protein